MGVTNTELYIESSVAPAGVSIGEPYKMAAVLGLLGVGDMYKNIFRGFPHIRISFYISTAGVLPAPKPVFH